MQEHDIRTMLAGKLRDARLNASLTAKEVGEKLGKSEKTVSAWEHGRGQPDADALFQLCELYGIVSMDYFFPPLNVEPMYVSPEEQRLLKAYRGADPVYQGVALEMLEAHPAEREQSNTA